jgi:hypothetical protein
MADVEDIPQIGLEGSGRPGLPSLLLASEAGYMNVTTCAAASKRVGKRFFGLQRYDCRAGTSLINAVRHGEGGYRCNTLCAPDYVCRGGGKDPIATSLYVLKNGKGELWVAAASGQG